MTLHLFGAATATGEALRQLAGNDLVGYSRQLNHSADWLYFADLANPSDFHSAGPTSSPSLWINLAPIWSFSPFLEHLACHHRERLRGLQGVIACSSSSVITKRFSNNKFDRDLVSKLLDAEDCLISTCQKLSIPCIILRPTLIYGRVGNYRDRNLSLIVKFMRRLPFLILPNHTGYRQPIHASQLAAVIKYFSELILDSPIDSFLNQRIALGGDLTLSYAQMMRALQTSLPLRDPARSCFLLPLPNRLFFSIASPLLLLSPKKFESVLRIGSNLSGFTQVHELLGSAPQSFPVLPFD